MNRPTQVGADGKHTQVSQADGSEVSAWHHECEWTTEADAEADLRLHYNHCSKNPGHKNFIPIGQFSIDHLPPDYRDEDFVEYTKIWADLTVKVCVRYTSMDRPKTCPHKRLGKYVPGYKDKVGKPYPFSASRGKDILRTGTAWVRYVDRYEGQCKCEVNCPHKDGGKVWLLTARHVVYDTSEAEKSELIFHYDSEEDEKKIRVLRGRGVGACSTEMDWSYVSFYSHDVKFLIWLEETLAQREDLEVKLYFKCIKPKLVGIPDLTHEPSLPHLPVIIVSHPHGCAKMATVGELTQRLEGKDKGKDRYVAFNYTADTCRGSSGASICFVDWRMWRETGSTWKFGLETGPPHSGTLRDGLNRSASWLWE